MEPFVRESFDRNARHIVKKFPELNTHEPNDRYICMYNVDVHCRFPLYWGYDELTHVHVHVV